MTIVSRELQSFLGNEGLISSRNSRSAIQTVCPEEVVEGALLIVLQSVLQNQARELCPVCGVNCTIAEVELFILCRIGLNIQVILGVGNVDEDITIQKHVTGIVLNHDTYQRLTVNSSSATE